MTQCVVGFEDSFDEPKGVGNADSVVDVLGAVGFYNLGGRNPSYLMIGCGKSDVDEELRYSRYPEIRDC